MRAKARGVTPVGAPQGDAVMEQPREVETGEEDDTVKAD